MLQRNSLMNLYCIWFLSCNLLNFTPFLLQKPFLFGLFCLSGRDIKVNITAQLWLCGVACIPLLRWAEAFNSDVIHKLWQWDDIPAVRQIWKGKIYFVLFWKQGTLDICILFLPTTAALLAAKNFLHLSSYCTVCICTFCLENSIYRVAGTILLPLITV